MRSIVATVPRDLPAAALASILVRRASRAGLDLSEYTEVAAGAGQVTEDSAGRMLMSRITEVQAAGIDPESALRRSCFSLRARILRAEEMAGETALSDLDVQERERIWTEAAAD